MPADDYDARALALPIDEPSPSSRRSVSPTWTRRPTSFRRNGSPYSSHTLSLKARLLKNAERMQKRAMKTYKELSPLHRILVGLGTVIAVVLGILFLIYNERIFGVLAPLAKKWRDITAGWLILWILIFMVSFPPLIGYSSLLTIAGFVYGFPNGWFIAASATIVGSTVSFILSRSLLKNVVHRLIANDKRFAALALTLKHDGLKLLIMIRLCPLPYSLSNGAIATFPTVHWASFALATTIVSPKLMLHIFIGSQLDKIAEQGGKMDAKTKALSYLSILIGVTAGILTGWFMYKKTKQRARELEAEERESIQRASADDLDREYADDPDALEAVEALRQDDDDISLRSAYEDEISGYHDLSEGEDGDQDDVFKSGGGDEEDAIIGRN
ncbi:hypothetical protein AOQ84DRAFT_349283 [Glonium stellatum]|uniref:Golgi apparatus membrane protein TVP38 n=1 Tax=Glonium stellatum TaxID=574774 RepID=A0A8E2EP98_9PEZI|nr:hypothetical protein AOQ84DRAFT_349283 [Glonium stellatum]